jgi:hypothetical protein
MRGEEEEDQAIWSKYFEKYTPSSIYPSFILKSRNPFMHAHLCFFIKKHQIVASASGVNKFLPHMLREINEGRNLISFPWSLSQIQINLR